jgi:glycosyltransferase involved in cell wall biosynthesis
MSGTRRALICSPLMPAFDRESGSRRVFGFIELLREGGWSVTFAARSAQSGERYIDMLQQRGVETYTSLDDGLDCAIASGQFDLALLAFWYLAEQCLPKIRRLSPHTRVIVDSVDLHFLRNARQRLQPQRVGVAPASLDSTYANELMRELNTYVAADAVLAVSDKEAALVDDLAGGPGVAHVVADSEEIQPSTVPLEDRVGILFVGNFHHPPNVEAARYLLREIVPRVDQGLLAAHPVSIVGNALEEHSRELGPLPKQVKLVGWVPSVEPYLQRARINAVPLLHGAGTKRKVIQSLMVGTPTVASRIGVEGLGLCDGEHALVADDPDLFASHIGNLLQNPDLWERIARDGFSHGVATHGQAVVRRQFDDVIANVLARQPKRARLSDLVAPGRTSADDSYARVVEGMRDVVRDTVPAGARLAVISKGDEELLRLDGVSARHFPTTDAGQYAGYYPADSAAAIAHLQAQRVAGIEFLVVPRTAFWWFDYYARFREHLERHYSVLRAEDDTCVIFDLRQEGSRYSAPSR